MAGNATAATPDWDIFVSHASEDKAILVAPLAASLRRFGLRVWYDEFTLTLGDSLSRSIDKGLAKSRYGLVVLSPNFIEKDWPEYELRGLVAREVRADKVILPLWHNVTREHVLAFSPPLADKLAVVTTGLSPVQIAVKVIEVVAPHLFTRIHRRLAFLEAARRAKVEVVDADTLHESPFRHEQLPEDQLRRVRLLRAALLEVRPLTMQEWVDGFRRDLHPADEIRIWERLTATFLEVAAYLKLNREQRHQLFRLLVAMSRGATSEDLKSDLAPFTRDQALLIVGSLNSSAPLVEVARVVSQPEVSAPPRTVRVAAKRIDVASDDDVSPSPDDLPEELMMQLLEDSGDDE